MFLHGLFGLNSHWHAAVRELVGGGGGRSASEPARCVCFEVPLQDLRGADCTIDGVTHLTREFLRTGFGHPSPETRAPIPPVVLVGSSLGGHVALRIALEHPDWVRGLVLAGSSGLIEKPVVSQVKLRPSREWLRQNLGQMFHDPVNIDESDVERVHGWVNDRDGARAMVRLSKSARLDRLADRLAKITAPALLVWGRQDVITPPEAAEEFLARLPDARIRWLDRCGHAPQVERPGEFAAAIVAFLEELGRRQGVPK